MAQARAAERKSPIVVVWSSFIGRVRSKYIPGRCWTVEIKDARNERLILFKYPALLSPGVPKSNHTKGHSS